MQFSCQLRDICLSQMNGNDKAAGKVARHLKQLVQALHAGAAVGKKIDATASRELADDAGEHLLTTRVERYLAAGNGETVFGMTQGGAHDFLRQVQTVTAQGFIDAIRAMKIVPPRCLPGGLKIMLNNAAREACRKVCHRVTSRGAQTATIGFVRR